MEASQEDIKKLKAILQQKEDKCTRLQLEIDELQRDDQHLQEDLARKKSLNLGLEQEVEVSR